MSRDWVHIGKINVTKTYGYIGNTSYQIQKLLEAKESDTKGKVFYLGDSNNYNLRIWADEIARISNSKKIRCLPKFLVLLIALLGSLLKKLRINIPITFFRYKNMTTDNIINLNLISKFAPKLPFTRKEGIKKTVYWMKNSNNSEF